MIRFWISLITCFLIQFASAQAPVQMGSSSIHFQITHKDEIIDFLVMDTLLEKPRPILLFCQGSLPVPLFANLDGYGL